MLPPIFEEGASGPAGGLRGEIHLWYARPETIRDDFLLARYHALLQREEQQRHEAFKLERVRHEYLVARAIVRCVLSRYGSLPPSGWRFRSNAHGRPEIDPPQAIRFNLTHCQGLVVCAVAEEREVGVDAEPLARGDTVLELARHVLSPAEIESLARLPEAARRNVALTLWTLKEAYLKALGVGLSGPLASLSFDLSGPRVALQREVPPAQAEERWEFVVLDWRDHRVSVAVTCPLPERPVLRVWETTPLAWARHRPDLEAVAVPGTAA